MKAERLICLIDKAKTGYGRLPQAAKASIWFTIFNVFQKGLSFLTTPIFTRMMSTTQYGQVTMYHTWYALLATFTTLNLDVGAFNNGMMKYENRREQYISSMQGLTSVLTLLVFGVYLADKAFWDRVFGLPESAVLLMFGTLFFVPSSMFWSARQRYEYKYKALTVLLFTNAILTTVISVWVVKASEDKGMARIATLGIYNIVEYIVIYFYNFRAGKTVFNKEFWTFALRFNFPLIPHYLSIMLLGQADRIMIEHFCGKGDVAIYSLAYSISLLMNIVTTSINASLIPWMYQKMANGEMGRLRSVTSAISLMVAMISVIPALFAPEVIAIMAPTEYASAIWVVPPVSTAVFFTFLYQMYSNIEFYYEESAFSAAASMAAAVCNIVLNALFIPRFGFIAAGYTTMISYILLAAVHYAYMRHVVKKHGGTGSCFDDRRTLALCLVYVVVVALLLLLYRNTAVRYGCIAGVVLVLIWKRRSVYGAVKKLLELKGRNF